MTPLISDAQRTRLTLAGICIVPGLVYYLSSEFWPSTPAARGLVVAVIFFVSGWTVINHLAWTGRDRGRLAVIAAIPPLVFAISAFWVWQQIPTGTVNYQMDDVRMPTLIVAAMLSIFFILPLIQIYHRSGTRSYPYGEVFNLYWHNLFVVGIAGLVIGAFWAVIALWSALFRLIDITFFDDLFFHAAFVSLSLSILFGYGIALGKERERLTSFLRNIFLAILKALTPLVAIVALIFLLALPFTGLQPLWDTNYASFTLLWLIVVLVLFFNGAYQDGSDGPPYPAWLRYVVQASLVALPIYSLITYRALYLRIDQHGLTPDRFYGVLFATLGFAVGLGYTVSVFLKSDIWMGTLRRVNMAMVFVFVAGAVLVHTPILDPLRWSARNQYNRLAQEEVGAEEFDFGYLRFQLGHLGYERLEELERLSDHPQAEIIRTRIQEARTADSYWALRPEPEVLISEYDLDVIGTESAVPAGFVEFLITDLAAYQADNCRENQDCSLLAVNIDNDEDLEYALVLSGDAYYDIFIYELDEEGSWRNVGYLLPTGSDRTWPARDSLFNMIRMGNIESVPVVYTDLKIGDLKLQVIR